ncbi:MAG: hypothetical protein BWY74_00799 [Firmicutes bacterium ADurb.Bin419]|nr:MAG: hypothetical protein BWY74_00799 [Firmicutes bacterium ADurb.Bin419]
MMNRTIKKVIDTRLANIKISSELENKIIDSPNKTRSTRKRPSVVVVAAVILVMLSVSVMAASITNFGKLLSIISPQVEQNLQPIKLSSEDNGIKMEVLAAMSDNNTTIAYISIQDLTADRVGDSIDLYNYSISKYNSATSEVIWYDAASKTAFIKLLGNGGKNLEGKIVTLQVDSFLSNKQSYKLFDTGIDLMKVIGSTTISTIPLDMKIVSGGSGDLFDEFRKRGIINVLKTDQTNIALPNISFAHISNIGIIDGKLHIQTKWTGGGIDDHGTFILANDSGDKTYPSSIYFSIDKNGKAIYGRDYIEFIFEINETEINKYKLFADHFTTYGHYTEGKWQNTFKLEAMEKDKEVDIDMYFGEFKVNRLSVSPIGVTLIGTGNTSDTTKDISVLVKMLNGRVYTLNSSVKNNENGKFTWKFMSLEPIKVMNVKEVSINGKVVELK